MCITHIINKNVKIPMLAQPKRSLNKSEPRESGFRDKYIEKCIEQKIIVEKINLFVLMPSVVGSILLIIPKTIIGNETMAWGTSMISGNSLYGYSSYNDKNVKVLAGTQSAANKM